MALALVLFLFALPFVLLLSADLKRNRRSLTVVALLIVGMHVVEMFWLIVPSFNHAHGSEEHTPWLLAAAVYVAALVGVCGVWLGVYLWQIQRLPLLPLHSPEGEGDHGQAAHH